MTKSHPVRQKNLSATRQRLLRPSHRFRTACPDWLSQAPGGELQARCTAAHFPVLRGQNASGEPAHPVRCYLQTLPCRVAERCRGNCPGTRRSTFAGLVLRRRRRGDLRIPQPSHRPLNGSPGAAAFHLQWWKVFSCRNGLRQCTTDHRGEPASTVCALRVGGEELA